MILGVPILKHFRVSTLEMFSHDRLEAPVAQWVKRWPADLAVQG